MKKKELIRPLQARKRVVFTQMSLNTVKGNMTPAVNALRAAIKKYSAYYWVHKRGYHIHHQIPFEAIAEVWMQARGGTVGVWYNAETKRYTLHDTDAEAFAYWHDTVLMTYNLPPLMMTADDHTAIHAKLRLGNEEARLIEQWTQKLTELL